jgi:uncharacterized membrane protein YeiB
MTPVRTRLQSIDALRGFAGFGSLVWVWVYFGVLIPLYIPTAAHSQLKARRPG